MAPSPSDDLQRSKTRNCLLILAWVDSRSRQLIVATRRKLSRPRFLGHEIRAGARKGKKNQRRSLRHGLGSSLVPADIRRLEKIGVLTEEDLLRRKKNWTDTGPRFDCSFGLRRGYSKRILRSGKFYRRYRDVLLFDADGTTRWHSSSRFLSYDGPQLAEYLLTKR